MHMHLCLMFGLESPSPESHRYDINSGGTTHGPPTLPPIMKLGSSVQGQNTASVILLLHMQEARKLILNSTTMRVCVLDITEK